MPTILLVEDYDDSRSMMKFVLENNGYHVIEAMNGLEAIDHVKTEAPDLILMDVSLPQMDGLEAVRHIKTIAQAEHIPVICLTAHSTDYQQQALEAGCATVILKPFDVLKLPEIVGPYIKKE
jgi:CheY-like chemotaxis protein